MPKIFSKSNFLRWGYRMALVAAAFGFLASLNIAYVDMLDGKMDRAAAGAALGLSSIVLAVAVILGRRLRRRSKELVRRLEKLEHSDHKIVKYVLSLPKDLEKHILEKIDTRNQKLLDCFQLELANQQETMHALQSSVVDHQEKLTRTQAEFEPNSSINKQ